MLSYACAAWESEPRIVGSNEEAGVSALPAPEPRTSISRALSVAVGSSVSRITRSAPSRPEVGAVGWTRSTDSTISSSRTLLEPRVRSFHPEFRAVIRKLPEDTRPVSAPAVLINNSVVSSSLEQALSFSLSLSRPLSLFLSLSVYLDPRMRYRYYGVSLWASNRSPYRSLIGPHRADWLWEERFVSSGGISGEDDGDLRVSCSARVQW